MSASKPPEERRASLSPGKDAAERAALLAALFAAGFSVAGHVLGKAVRDALYLATFPVEKLPYFVLGTGVLSAISVSIYTRLNTRFGPRAVVPALGILSALSLPPLWYGARAGHPAVIGALFAWITISGTFLTSGFWAVLGERFDPRRARQVFGWMGISSTVGGLAGGFGAHESLHVLEPEALLLLLAGVNLLTSAASWKLGRSVAPRETKTSNRETTPPKSNTGLVRAVSEVFATPYLRDIAVLVAVGTVAGTLADYILKDAAVRTLGSKRQLAEFFSLFHGGVGAVTLGVQLLIARPLVHKKGLGAALAALPIWISAGALAVVVAPVLWAATVLRGGENAVRNSFHRSGYELLFVPLAAGTKRLVKPILDTLFERVFDGVGALAILLLVGLYGLSSSRLALFVLALGAIQLVLILRLRKGYVETLSSNLAARAVELEAVAEAADDDATAREAIRSTLLDMRSDELRKSMASSQLGKSLMKSLQIDMSPAAIAALRGAQITPSPASPVRPALVTSHDSAVQLVLDLTHADVAVVRSAVDRWDWKDKRAVPFLVRLLARDEVHDQVTRALARAGDRVAGILTDHLDDPDEVFAVRRRLPRALAACKSDKALDALTRALADQRFEVRYHAGAALERIQAHAARRPAPDPVWKAIREEVKKSRQMWEAQRLLDVPEADDVIAGAVERRGAHSLRHVFRLLGLVLEAKSLELSYQAVQADDPHFRGVGLEYLENVLPPDVRKALWPLIGDDEEQPPLSRTGRSLAEVMKDLAASGTIARPKITVIDP
jgi:ATP:ADP antiporter, AAA family